MSPILLGWAVSAVLIAVLAIVLGRQVSLAGSAIGILVDQRGRFSLTHFQLVVWTIVILSLISGVFWGRLLEGVNDPLAFTIPEEVLGLIGIAVGSSVTTTVAKSGKDATAAARIPASSAVDRPRLAQIFLLEEGEFADRVVDVTKFQNFVITVVLVVAYVALAIQTISDANEAQAVTALPDFSGTFLTLLGISHAAYVLGKLPNQVGVPPGLTVANRAGLASGTIPGGVTPRNPG